MYKNLNKVPTEMGTIKFWQVTFFYSAAKLLSVHGRNLHVTLEENNNSTKLESGKIKQIIFCWTCNY